VNSTNSPYLHIRKIPKNKLLIDDLIRMGVMNDDTARYLKEAFTLKQGIVFCGKGASGKTTMMNALLECIPHNESGLVIQESEELFSNTHPDLMFQKVITSKGEGKIQYTLKDLAINGLLTDLDRFIVGEIKGEEALYFLNACYTGHKVMCSTHSNNSYQALDKIADYIKYESDYSKEDALRMLSSLSTVVFMKDFKVTEISEIVGWDESIKNIKYRRIL
jgi:Flp pilus assembly protein, ATPase CpaF